MCGPTNAETTTAGQSQNLATSVAQNYNTNFGASSAILGNITNMLTPIFEAGPNQTGFSAGENAALTSGAINQNAANYRSAATVAGANEARAGGTTYAPTGGQQEVNAQIASNAAENLSNTENQITEANYAQGRQNFQSAEAGLFGAQSGYAPNATGALANQTNQTAFGEEQQIAQQQNAWVGDVAGLVGGLGGAAIGNLNVGPFKSS